MKFSELVDTTETSKGKIKLSLCLTKQVMHTYWETELQVSAMSNFKSSMPYSSFVTELEI
jgi:hypothetical protein